MIRDIPGGGSNNRSAAKLCVDGEWQRCAFEELRPLSIAMFFEEDGSPVADAAGCYVFFVAGQPEKDEEGVWRMKTVSMATLAAHRPCIDQPRGRTG